MELDWTTFSLEVINFLVLVWLLRRFLYRPLMEIIAKRRQQIEQTLAQAAAGQAEAAALKRQYETRLSDWEAQKRGALEELDRHLEQERNQRLKRLETELEQQRLRNQARDQQQQLQWRSQAEAEALQSGGAFAARLLQALSGPELDARLQQLFIEQLASLPESILRALRESWQDTAVQIELTSATPLDESQQGAIRRALEQRLGPGQARWQYLADARLIAGVRLSIGGHVLQANLRDELRLFAEAAYGA